MNKNLISKYLNFKNIKNASKTFAQAKPFSHCVIDNFLDDKFALTLEKEFPDFNNSFLFEYDNALEIKKALNDWHEFPPNTYQFFSYLNSFEFVDFLSKIFNCNLYPDYGLNGWVAYA